jgi:hypothetical protein
MPNVITRKINSGASKIDDNEVNTMLFYSTQHISSTC